jgi:hypothetical protein
MGTSSLFIILALGAKDDIASADVPGAYLEADMTKRVLMRLDKFLAEILASIDPTLRPPEARRDVCGGAEQGLVRMHRVGPPVVQGAARVLEAIGFAANPYDRASSSA